MALIVTVTSASAFDANMGPLITCSYDEFERDNADALTAGEFAELFDHGTLTIGGGSAPLLTVTLTETDAAKE